MTTELCVPNPITKYHPCFGFMLLSILTCHNMQVPVDQSIRFTGNWSYVPLSFLATSWNLTRLITALYRVRARRAGTKEHFVNGNKRRNPRICILHPVPMIGLLFLEMALLSLISETQFHTRTILVGMGNLITTEFINHPFASTLGLRHGYISRMCTISLACL